MEKLQELKQYTFDEYSKLLDDTCIEDEYSYKNTIFAIPDYRVPRLYSKLEPFLKKANKLNVPYTLEEIGKVNLHDNDGDEQNCIIIKLEFQIQIDGWKFIAAIDHLPNGNVIRNISGADLPEKFRTCEGYCEHCKTHRRRKATYVVYNEEQGYKQVGKNCLFLYTGIDLSKIASAMDIWNYVSNYISISDDEFEGGFGSSYKLPTDAREVLALAYKLINLFGYVKKGSESSTYHRYCSACDYLSGYMKNYQEKTYKAYHKFITDNGIKFMTDEDFEMADKIIAHFLEQKITSDYINNLNVIFSGLEEKDITDTDGTVHHYKHCYMDGKYTNLVISAVQTYNTAMGIKLERQLKAEKERTESNYVGEIGERISFKISDMKVVTSWQNNFGYYPTTVYIYKIVDEKGNVFTWKTSTNIKVQQVLESNCTIKGTVKEHKEYNTVKQTELQRCKIEN